VKEQIANKDGPVQTVNLDYGAVMVDALRNGGVQGLTVGEMSKRIKVLDKLEAAIKDDLPSLAQYDNKAYCVVPLYNHTIC